MKRFFNYTGAYIALLITALVLFTFTIRGSVGNPTPVEIDTQLNSNGHAFETSQERSRYAMILALVNDNTVAIDNYASMGTPDIGFINGHYYSFFPPGASFIALPFFIIGTKLGIAQLATFSVMTIFSILSMLMIVRFCQKLGLHWTAALFAALAFGFATNAWGYGVTFYAHIISSFFILVALYSTVFIKNWKGALLFWLSYSLAVYIDFPNLFIFFPMALVQAFRFFSLTELKSAYQLSFKWIYLVTPLLFVALMGIYAYYNYVQFGSATTLSNTIPRVKDLKDVDDDNIPEQGKQAVTSLQTRHMLQGFHSFIVSTDRGLLVYTPVAFLAIAGLGLLSKKEKETEVLLLTVPLTCLTLYTMFGDPYGGWAFGSRYVLAVMPELMILAAIGLQYRLQNIWIKIIYSIVFTYSAAVSLLAPLTTNVIPPLVEARGLGLKASYIINIEMLQRNKLNSFFYNHVLNQSISGWVYYGCIAFIIISIGLTLIWLPKKTEK